MNTRTIAQFETLGDTMLSTIEGGKNGFACVIGTAGMAGVGFMYAGPAGAAVLGGATAMRIC